MDRTLILDTISSLWTIAQQAPAAGTPAPGWSPFWISTWNPYVAGVVYVFGIFILPFIISHLVTKAIRMPSHSARLGIMLAAIFGGLLFAWGNNFELKRGIDMRGGTNLVYNIMPGEDGEQIDAASLASALSDRINPAGTKEIVIRPLGESQIEIIVPDTDEMALRRMKELLQNSGQLEFRIVSNTRDHEPMIDRAVAQAAQSRVPQTDVLNAEGRVVGRWYRVGRDEKQQRGVLPLKGYRYGDVIRNAFTGEILNPAGLDTSKDFAMERWLLENNIREIDVLMALEYAGVPFPAVAGDDLASASMTYNNKTGAPEVAFRLNAAGASKMTGLTGGINTSEESFKRRMAIIMDKTVLSAPQLNSTISANGVIQGNFTREEVDFLVTVLRSGRLPATLSPEPASENMVGAGLGATTIRKGAVASAWAIVVTFACILAYYRFAGVVASLALLINGLLIFGIMIFIQQPLTLPGLAGLVLTVGMSVDANVLIFERIREEKAKGSAPRMSIRNGFDRAFTTIIDSNLTTLIAAIVLYWIGTDQVRGFAVALIIGIATSMFTATFCSRIVFEIAEKLKRVSLSMADGVGFLKKMTLGDEDIDFMRRQKACAIFSLLLIALGIAAVAVRGKEILNIDFTGGTSVTFQLQQPMSAEELRSITRDILTTDKEGNPVQSTLVRVQKEPLDTVYTLVASIDDPEYLEEKLLAGFAKNNAQVVTYRVKYLPGNTTTSQRGVSTPFRLVALQDNSAEAADPQTDAIGGEAPQIDASQDAPAEVGPDAAVAGETTDEVAQAVPGKQDVFTDFQLKFEGSYEEEPGVDAADNDAKFNGTALLEQLIDSAEAVGVELNTALIELHPVPVPEDWRINDVRSYTTWSVRLPADQAATEAIVQHLQAEMEGQPRWLSLNKIGTRVADEMQQRAIAAILISLLFIVAYIWFRFQKVAYGLAAVVALVHDVLITLGVLAMCHWLAGPLSFLLIEDFKIGLTEVAAFLTIIGYSLNDTIVVFDRIREVRGRSPRLTPEMINLSVNQTLSRTLLTSGTTLLTVILLFVFGGEGIHTFSFSLLVGIVVGTYSSIFVASPVLLWISNRELAKQQQQRTAIAG